MKKTSIGGQALIEGIMMKGPDKTVLAVRYTDGTIRTEALAERNFKKKCAVFRWPIIRGVVGFAESMLNGYKALMRSAELSGMTELEEAAEQQKKAEKAARKKRNKEDLKPFKPPNGDAAPDDSVDSAEDAAAKAVPEAPAAETEKEPEKQPGKISNVLMGAAMVIGCVLGVALSVFLFMWLPARVFDLLYTLSNGALSGWFKPLIEGVLKIILFLCYLFLVSQTKDIKRVFQYHGAEHKTIFCYESGAALTVENCREKKRFHPRCGTSFMVLMLVVGIVLGYAVLALFPAVKTYRLLWVAVKILIVPLTCGLGYELIKLCGRYDNVITRMIAAPGLWVQRITTKEPDDSMLEVAICALQQVIPEDPEKDRW